jgi:hypothetical protein
MVSFSNSDDAGTTAGIKGVALGVGLGVEHGLEDFSLPPSP